MQALPAPATAAAMEEFNESDVLWPDHHHCHHHGNRCCHGHQKQQNNGRRPRVHAAGCAGDLRRRFASSAPVAIPATAVMWSSEQSTRLVQCYCYEDGGGGGDEASFVPPHVLVARRWCSEERAASSMCVGQGRTLKGRDLQCVRAAVLRMTGFLET